MGDDGSCPVADGVAVPSVRGEGEEDREGAPVIRLVRDMTVDRLRARVLSSSEDSALFESAETLRFGARVKFKGASCDGSKRICSGAKPGPTSLRVSDMRIRLPWCSSNVTLLRLRIRVESGSVTDRDQPGGGTPKLAIGMDLRISLSILDPGEMGWWTADPEGQTNFASGEEQSLRRGHGWIGAVDLKDIPLLELQKKSRRVG